MTIIRVIKNIRDHYNIQKYMAIQNSYIKNMQVRLLGGL